MLRYGKNDGTRVGSYDWSPYLTKNHKKLWNLKQWWFKKKK